MTRSSTLSVLALGLCVAASAAGASAQGLTLGKSGGAIGASASFPLTGTPGAPYLLLLSATEAETPLPGLGVTLDIDDDLVVFAVNLPGFVGTFPGSGRVEPSLPIPPIPALEGLTLSFQAIGNQPLETSNLARLTPQQADTFLAAREQPSVPIAGGSVARAPDDTLLFIGGSGPVAQRYDALLEEWSLAGASLGVGILSQATALDDGRVLFTGGIGLDGQPTDAASLYDPATGQTTTLAMGTARAGHGASRLGDGRVLVTGGFETVSISDPLALFAGMRNTTEIFDPATGAFAPGPNMLEARALHSSSELSNGEVLIAGGLSLIPIVNIPTVSATAYRYDPARNSFGLPALMNGARFLHSAVGLDDGKVLLAGGLTVDLSRFLQTGQITDIIIGTRDDVQLYRPSLFGFGTFTTVAGMQEGRAGAAVAALPGGGALIAGGFRLVIDIATQTFDVAATASADVFTQGPNAIRPTGSLASPRIFPGAVNLPDGTVMVFGGGGGAEIWQR